MREIKNPSTYLGRQTSHADVIYSDNKSSAVPRSSLLSIQSTPFPEINLAGFGTGRNSIQVQLGQDNTASLKKDREYIRRIIQDSKEHRAMSQ